MRFWQRLKDVMEQEHATPSELMDYTGLDQKGFTAYRNGSRTPSISTLVLIADFFNMTLSELLEGVDE